MTYYDNFGIRRKHFVTFLGKGEQVHVFGFYCKRRGWIYKCMDELTYRLKLKSGAIFESKYKYNKSKLPF